MQKDQVILALQSARKSHLMWLNCGKKLLSGHDLEYVQAPLKCTECDFGQWFYSDGQVLNGVPCFRKMEEHHQLFHKHYHTLYFAAPKVHRSKGIFSSKKRQAKQNQLLLEDYKKLEKQSVMMIHHLENLEKRVATMSSRLFERNIKGSLAK